MTPPWDVVVVGGANFAAALAVGLGEQRSPEDAGRFASEVAALLVGLNPPSGGPAVAPA
jgi:sugar/nucleoside kinase (ribokinase family)